MTALNHLREETARGVIISDDQGIVIYVNPRFSEIFGWPEDEILGKPITTIIPSSMHDAHHLGFSRFLATGAPRILNRPLKLKGVAKSGELLQIELILSAEKSADQWWFGACISPEENVF